MSGDFYVYKHTSPVGKVYIGITMQNPSRRWREGWGYRHQKHFYSAIIHYGWENFQHEILFSGLSFEAAKQKEIELIQLYKSNDRKFGYNVTSGGDNRKGHPASEETKKKLAEIQRGKKYSKESREKMSRAKKGKSNTYLSKPILQFDLKGNFIAEYPSMTKAYEVTGTPVSNMRKHILGERKQAGGFIWKYKKEVIT